MIRIDIKKEFEDMFPWHYDALSSQKQDCPVLGTLDFDFKPLVEHIYELCEKQDPKTSGKGFSHYFENNKIKEELINSRDHKFKKLFDTWIKSNWTMDNSCYYEFHDAELNDFYRPLLEAYENTVGKIQNAQLRVFVKPPMTALGLHADTFGTYKRKHNVKENEVFRAMTFIEDWEWGHYTLIGNEVLHQYKAGDTYQIQPNVFHCSGNMGFNPQITMNITGTKK
jgi:oxalate decarboxylase/phosphoglucose isomerase-like protein (cupin superfamily)|tara:strand:+ start:1097 stop:1771 length:675 start_codon:yes stop_codon:yes gene_type:complete